MHSLKAEIPAGRKESIYNAACEVLPAIAYGDAAGLSYQLKESRLNTYASDMAELLNCRRRRIIRFFREARAARSAMIRS